MHRTIGVHGRGGQFSLLKRPKRHDEQAGRYPSKIARHESISGIKAFLQLSIDTEHLSFPTNQAGETSDHGTNVGIVPMMPKKYGLQHLSPSGS